MSFHSPDRQEEAVNIWNTPSYYATVIDAAMRNKGIETLHEGDTFLTLTEDGFFCAKGTRNGGKMLVHIFPDEIRGFSLLPGEEEPSSQLPVDIVGDHMHDRNLKAETIADILATHIAPMVGVVFENTSTALESPSSTSY